MKKTIQLLTLLTTLALSSASLRAAATYLYWDGNGTDPGAGPAPAGDWGFDNFWSTDPAGSDGTNAWVNGAIAVFSAGTDATNAFTLFSDQLTPPTAAGLIFEEGQVTIAPSASPAAINMSDPVEFPIVSYTNAIVNSDLTGTAGVTKTGPGRVTLGGSAGGATYSGMNTVKEGILAYTTIYALGDWTGPTIVSNGAALQQAAAIPTSNGGIGEPLYLYGTGVTNSGAFFATSVNSGGKIGWGGMINLMSSVSINLYDPGQWTFLSPCAFVSASATITDTNTIGGSYNLIFGGPSGTIRLNNTAVVPPYPNGRVCYLGDGAIIKNGANQLRLETAGLYNGGFYFNEGKVTVRYPMFGQGPGGVGLGTIYVAATAGEFNNASTTIGIGNNMVLAAGSNVRFNINAAANPMTLSGVLSGPGGISVTNLGKVIISGANTYSGNTTILGNAAPASGGGTLALTGSGSIANSPVIEVQQNATFDVSGRTSTFVLGAGQTIKGIGTVVGNVIANGTISPGSSIGTITFNNDLTLGGNLAIDVNRSVPASDLIQVTGVLTNAGVGGVLVNNGGIALQVGDSFTICSQPVLNGAAMAVVGGGVLWTNELASSGKITVIAGSPVPATNLAATKTGPNSVVITGVGAANTSYGVFTSTDVTKPMSTWTLIGAAIADGSGVIQFTDTQATGAEKYYRFGQ
jgi:hypothetical protein